MCFPALGAAELEPRIDFFGEDCLSPSGRTQDKLREFLSPLIRGGSGGTLENLFLQDRRGRARAEMVLVTFAETKVTRLQGRNPA